MVRFARSGGLWPPPQSIDIIPQILLLLRVFSHGSHSSCCVYSPTDSTEFTEVLAECILPQISQIYTDCLGAFKGVHLSQVHQRNKRYIYIARLVHFLLWQAAKPSGDKCTP